MGFDGISTPFNCISTKSGVSEIWPTAHGNRLPSPSNFLFCNDESRSYSYTIAVSMSFYISRYTAGYFRFIINCDLIRSQRLLKNQPEINNFDRLDHRLLKCANIAMSHYVIITRLLLNREQDIASGLISRKCL